MTSLPKNRIESIDLLKGLVMVIMALDHVRDYFHYASNFFDPADPTKTSLAIFFTRWITHFCAPTFCFLAGISAFLIGKRKTLTQLSSFLIKRGLWLVFIELTVMTFGLFFDVQFRTFGLLVIWSLGISMIILAGLIHLPRKTLLLFCILFIFGHNLLDGVSFGNNLLWNILHQPTLVKISADTQLLVSYPIIPWFAVMGLGYYFGSFYDQSYDSVKRKKLFNTIGFASIILFIILRVINLYGDPRPWQHYDTFSKELISFLNPVKYPPSLLFLLMTLGGTFLFLANSEKLRGKAVAFFSTFGRVPFFYFVLHIYLIHITAMIFAELSGFGWKLFILPSFTGLVPELRGYGFNLITVYLIWIGIVIVLYPICKKFDVYKQNHKEKWWLSYL
ncbi:DUF1624 domain-containing protein [Flavobacterium sp.]|uniref:DUF1624 domain-containing protein n=1 Tax=Flavobacterium sp. TaxID=239 RepID=UPI002D021B54|nr:heparan-alpha-glucosaminide N-acetyltransferase domain-containing protein [Flavobacterium sp.]HSD09102.1 heparan-alpha-glucosaminide N-acetyltransferase domain-containing protein [Flavobacterium sp.]